MRWVASAELREPSRCQDEAEEYEAHADGNQKLHLRRNPTGAVEWIGKDDWEEEEWRKSEDRNNNCDRWL